MRWPNVFFAGLFAVLVSGCTEPNDLRCMSANDPKCDQFPGRTCKLVSNPGDPESWRCLPADGKCEAKAGVYLNTMACGSEKPICGTACTNMSCDCATCADFPGQENQTCATASSATPFCDKAAKRCTECGIVNAVQVGCSGTQPVCDAATNKCKPCSKHEDCKLAGGQGICKLSEYGVANTGACATDAEVAVVSGAAELNTAVNDPSKTFVLARPGTYNPILVQTTNVNKIVVGPGRDAAQSAQITGDGSFAAIKFVQAGKVLLDGFRLAGNAICNSNSDLTLLRSIVDVSSQVNGVFAADMDCRSVTVGHSQVVNAGRAGILIGADADYKVYNSLIIDTAKTAASAGAIINSSKLGLFAFNTLTRNTNGGVICGQFSGSPKLLSSIVVNNGQAGMTDGLGQGKDQVGTRCVLTDIVLGIASPPAGGLAGMPVFANSGQAATDYKLKTTDQACCSAKTSVNPNVPTDFFGAIRGTRVSSKTDVGFAESP